MNTQPPLSGLMQSATPVGTIVDYMPGFGNYLEIKALLQDDYINCWKDIEKRFDGTPGKK